MIRQWCTEEFPSLFFNVDLSWQWSGFFCRVLRWHFATVVAVVTTAHAGVFWTSGVRCVAVDGCVVCAALGEVTGVVTSYSVVAFPGFLFSFNSNFWSYNPVRLDKSQNPINILKKCYNSGVRRDWYERARGSTAQSIYFTSIWRGEQDLVTHARAVCSSLQQEQEQRWCSVRPPLPRVLFHIKFLFLLSFAMISLSEDATRSFLILIYF